MEQDKKKVLIVEDDPNFVSILKDKFSQEGFLTCTAEDGKEGVSAAANEKPDLIIADVLLPVLNGADMANQIREKNNTVPIIFLTNVKETEYSDITKKISNAKCLIKSDVRIEDIIQAAKNAL